ncbi:hypothetical protein [Acinetobacter ursingii]|uniref:hypothetical protein n=1 Tax=Acinetobacter ursingii TaxID=108980 RepID=UPI00125040CB|nr:hypothetical protein [Acinetobacter ursingii]
MSYGLKVLTPNAVLQVDDTFSNLSLYSKITITVPVYGYSSIYTGSVPSALQGKALIIAARPLQSGSDIYFGVSLSGNSYTIRGTRNSGLYSFDVEVYFFTEQEGNTSGYGLLVRNKTNKVVFNSNLKYMRVSYVFNVPLPAITHNLPRSDSAIVTTENVALKSGRLYAVASTSLKMRIASETWAYPGDMDNLYHYTAFEFFGLFNINQNTITFRHSCTNQREELSSNSIWNDYDFVYGYQNCLVVDVTNY